MATASHRNFGLDVARSFAIVTVFLSHGLSGLAPLGIGVDLFFVLSGFLIGRIYLRGQSDAAARGVPFSMWSFWSARWFRTLPPYLAALALFAIAQQSFGNAAVHPHYALFLQNYLGLDGFDPSWSLCVEEHYYLALPVVGFLALKYVGRRQLLWLLPAIALLPLAGRATLAANGGLTGPWYWQTHLHAEGLILGTWLAYVFLDRPRLWQRMRTPAAAVSVLPAALLTYQITAAVQSDSFKAVMFLLYAIGFSAWVRLLYDLRWQPATAVGRGVKQTITAVALTSYSIYLVHTLLLTDLRVLVDAWPRGVLKTSTIFAGTIAGAIAFYFAVERPTILLRDALLNPVRPLRLALRWPAVALPRLAGPSGAIGQAFTAAVARTRMRLAVR